MVHGERLDISLNEAGEFDLEVEGMVANNGTHTIELWARDRMHEQAVKIDTEHVSLYRQRFIDLTSPDPSTWAGHSMSVMLVSPWTLPGGVPQPQAVGKPTLDENGFLVLDGAASSRAFYYKWHLEHLVSGEQFFLEGEIAGTEGLVPGLYNVTLTLSSFYRLSFYPDAQDSFYLLIPPRVDVRAQEAVGAVHARWVSERGARGKYRWVLYLAGHVFDEIGAAYYGDTSTELEVELSVNGEGVEVDLDEQGHFLTRVLIGSVLEEEYVVTLRVALPEDTHLKEVDELPLEYLHIFNSH